MPVYEPVKFKIVIVLSKGVYQSLSNLENKRSIIFTPTIENISPIVAYF